MRNNKIPILSESKAGTNCKCASRWKLFGNISAKSRKRKKSAQIKVLIFQYVAFLTWLFYILIRLTFNLSMFMVPIFNASPLARCPTVSSGISRT